VIGANHSVRNAFPAGAGKRRHGQGGGRRDERMGVRKAQHGQLFIGERRRQQQVQHFRRDTLATGGFPSGSGLCA